MFNISVLKRITADGLKNKTERAVVEVMPRHKNLLIPDKLKRNNFDLIRLLLAVAVLFSHCYIIYYGMKGHSLEPLARMTMGQTTMGMLAVNFFFIISGYLILNSFLHRRSLKSYLKKRALRICPGFIVAFLLSVFVFALLGNIEFQKTFSNWTTYFQSLNIKRLIIEFILFKQPSNTKCFATLPLSNVVNGSLWTIQYELICYLILPVLGIAGAIKRKGFSVIMFLLFYSIMLLQDYKGLFYYESHLGSWILNMNSIPRFFAYFFCGMCVYLYRNFIPRNIILLLISVAALVLSSIVFNGLNFIFPFAGTYLLFYFAYSKTIKFYDFARRGDMSYGVYLYAWPIQQLVLYFFVDITLYQLFFVSLFLTVLIAYFWSWKCIEKPFIALKGR